MTEQHLTPFGGKEIEVGDIDKAQIVVLPLCYENKPSYGTGSKEGPLHILDASVQLESLDEESLIDWGRLRIHTAKPVFPSDDPRQAILEMKQAAGKIFNKKKRLLSLGGDHATSLGPIMAAADAFPGMGVVQIDAHLDLRNEWNGSRYNHACVMRRVMDDMDIPAVQIGIRSFSAEEAEYIQKEGESPFYAHDIDPFDNSWIDKALGRLPETVYITIDLDGLDPAVIPGTGTPEPGGLSYRQLVDIIKSIGKNRTVVAADITELSKIKGTQVSEFTAAKIATKIFVYGFKTDATGILHGSPLGT